MKTEEFDYFLDESLIANIPASPRDAAKLMVVKGNDAEHKIFRDIYDYLDEGDALVVNSSRVINARIIFDGKKEIFLLKRVDNQVWNCMVRPGKFFVLGKKFIVSGDIDAEVMDILADGTRNIYFSDECALLELGQLPLPPYIKNHKITEEDYQTVYAKEEGSVAAPTAGLHFTDDLLKRLKEKGVKVVEVVLHVGRGTFLPVTSDNLEEHVMHKEDYYLSAESAGILNQVKANRGRIVAVGTTTVRVLESCFEENGFEEKLGATDIFIYPHNYQWKAVDVLVTNFHLPKSTLLMLVASFLEHKGSKKPVKDLMKIYQEAIENGYRFYSLGDAMIIV